MGLPSTRREAPAPASPNAGSSHSDVALIAPTRRRRRRRNRRAPKEPSVAALDPGAVPDSLPHPHFGDPLEPHTAAVAGNGSESGSDSSGTDEDGAMGESNPATAAAVLRNEPLRVSVSPLAPPASLMDVASTPGLALTANGVQLAPPQLLATTAVGVEGEPQGAEAADVGPSTENLSGNTAHSDPTLHSAGTGLETGHQAVVSPGHPGAGAPEPAKALLDGTEGSQAPSVLDSSTCYQGSDIEPLAAAEGRAAEAAATEPARAAAEADAVAAPSVGEAAQVGGCSSSNSGRNDDAHGSSEPAAAVRPGGMMQGSELEAAQLHSDDGSALLAPGQGMGSTETIATAREPAGERFAPGLGGLPHATEAVSAEAAGADSGADKASPTGPPSPLVVVAQIADSPGSAPTRKAGVASERTAAEGSGAPAAGSTKATNLAASDASSGSSPAAASSSGVAEAAATAGDNGSESEADDTLDETAVAISVLSAAALAKATAAPHPHPYAPRGETRRRTGTWETRLARRPPSLVAFGGGGLRELQALVDSVATPAIIDLGGRVVTLRGSAPMEPGDAAAAPPQAPSGAAGSGTAPSASAPAPRSPSTSLVLASSLRIPGWSRVVELAGERARMLDAEAGAAGAGASSTPAGLQQSATVGQHLSGGLLGSGGTNGGGMCLLLWRDDVVIANGTLQLAAGCRLLVSGRRLSLRHVEVVDAEAASWWRQATAMPATCLQPSALITVTPEPRTVCAAATTPAAAAAMRRASSSGAGGPSLELDECGVSADGRDRDLLRLDGAGGRAASAAAAAGGSGASPAVTARYCRLRGGANAAVATLRSSLHLDCCVLEGYASAGVVAIDADVRLVGSRLLGAAGSIVGVQAASSSRVSVLGCFLAGHASNLDAAGGSTAQLQGCVLGRTDCRTGLTLHSAAAASTGATTSAAARTMTAAAARPVASGAAGRATGGAHVALSDCEIAHAVAVGVGGELELERCSFALPAPAPAARPVSISSSPALAARLAAAAAMPGRGQGSSYAGTVAAGASLRVVGCRASSGSGEDGGAAEGGAVVVLEAAGEAAVHVSGSPGVLVRRGLL